MNPIPSSKQRAPSLNVETIFAELNAQPDMKLEENQKLKYLSQDELEELSEKIAASKNKQLDSMATRVAIESQQKRLALQTQLPEVPSTLRNPLEQFTKEKEPVIAPKNTAPLRVPSPAPAVPVAPKTPAKAPGLTDNINSFSTGVTETLFGKEYTKDWSDLRKQRTGLLITGGTVAVAAVLATWAIYSYMKGKDVKEHTHGTPVWKWIVGLGALALAGAGIYKAVETYQSMRQTVATIQKEIDDARAIKDTLEGKAKQAAEARITQLEQKLAEKKNEEQKKTETKEEKHPNVDQAMDAARTKARTMTAVGLLMTNGDLAVQAGIDTSNKNETAKVTEMLTMQKVLDLPVQTIESISTVGQVDTLISGLTPAQKNALFFVILLTQKIWKKEGAKKLSQKDPSKVRVGDLLDIASIVPNAFGQIGSALEGKSLSSIADIRTILAPVFASETMMHQFVDQPVIREGLLRIEPELKGKESRFAFFCLMQKNNSTLSSIVKEEPRTADEKIFLRALKTMREELLTEESRKYLTLYAHNDPQFTRILETHLSGDLNVQDAAQLFAYLQLAKDPAAAQPFPQTLRESKGTEVFLLQMKMLDLVSKVNMAEGIRMRDILLLRTNTNIDLPDDVKKMLGTLVTMAGKQAVNTLSSWLYNMGLEAKTLAIEGHREMPVVAGSIDTAAGAGVGYSLYRWWNIDWIEKMGENLHKLPKSRIPFWMRMTQTGRDAWNMGRTANIADTIYDIQTKIKTITDPLSQSTLMKSYEHLHYRGYQPSSFQKLATEIAAVKNGANAADMQIIQAIETEIDALKVHKDILQVRRFGFFRRQWKKALELTNGIQLRMPSTAALTPKVTPMKVAGGVLTAGMTAYDIADYLQERPRLLQQRALESDPMKKDMITDELRSKEASIGINTVGGGLMLTGIFTIPATIAVLGNAGREAVRSGIAEGEEYTLLNQKKFATFDAPGILQTIDRSSQGYISNIQSASVGESAKNANTFIRGEAYRAYFAQLSDMLPPLEEEYLSAEERKENTAKQRSTLETKNADQKATFARAAEDYIRQATHGEFKTVTPEVLRKAELYARMVVGEWKLFMLTGKERTLETISWNDTKATDGTTPLNRARLVDVEERQTRTLLATTLMELKKNAPSRFAKDAGTILLLDSAHELADLEKRIRSTDLEGWEITGGEEQSRNMARRMAAHLFQQELQKNLQWLEKKSTITPVDMEAVLLSLRRTLSFDPDTYYHRGVQEQWKSFGNPSALENIGSLLTVGGMYAHLEESGIIRQAPAPKSPRQIEEERNRLNSMRLNKGEEFLQQTGADKETYVGGDFGSVWSVSFGTLGVFDRPLYVFFDATVGKWKVAEGSWISTDTGQKATALKGVPAESYTFPAQKWGGQEKYQFVVRSLADINKRPL